MWLMLNDAFLSIVDKSTKPGRLLVRARRPGDIERVFPGVNVRESFGTDYRYRADVPRQRVATEVAGRLMAVDYSNFKSSTKDRPLHDAYMRVWNVMERLQPGGAYARDPRAPRPLDTLWNNPAPGDPFFDDEDEVEGAAYFQCPDCNREWSEVGEELGTCPRCGCSSVSPYETIGGDA